MCLHFKKNPKNNWSIFHNADFACRIFGTQVSEIVQGYF